VYFGTNIFTLKVKGMKNDTSLKIIMVMKGYCSFYIYCVPEARQLMNVISVGVTVSEFLFGVLASFRIIDQFSLLFFPIPLVSLLLLLRHQSSSAHSPLSQLI